MITKILISIDLFLGRVIFGSLLSFSYNIINKKIYKKFKKNTYSKELNEKGYFIFERQYKNFSDYLNAEIDKQKDEANQHRSEGVYYYEINEKLKNKIKNFFSNECKDLFIELQNIYNHNIFITNIILRRTFHINNKSKEVFNNFYHFDKYTGNHLKIFFNIHDMNKNNGPTKIIPKKMSKSILKKNIFSTRGNYFNENTLNKDERQGLYYNKEKAGSLIICNTTECLHAADVPDEGRTRDILTLTAIAIPGIDSTNLFHLENEGTKNFLWNGSSKISKIYAKPNLNKIFSFYRSF